MSKSKFLAHAIKSDSSREHCLVEHLRFVAEKAGAFAEKFDSKEWAYIAGIWHDLGKFNKEFQNYILSIKEGTADAHLEDDSSDTSKKRGPNHSSAGALLAIREFGPIGRILAYLIAGHHAGLPDWERLSNRLQEKKHLELALKDDVPESILTQKKPSKKPRLGLLHLWIRMLFSSLVDADFLDTEAFMDQEKSIQRANYPSLKELKEKFDAYMEKKGSTASKSDINRCRGQVLENCRKKGRFKPGIYTLTVPTGGGKTLSSMAFALEHALEHKKDRIIYAIPYTTIIEQTAKIYREIPGWDQSVIEHHSNLDADKETLAMRLATENWDAPVIVTTNVQLFESLFAVRSSRVRKLHNIVNSVIVLDEAQSLPVDFLIPILEIMKELVETYKVTFVLATATQPALKDIRSGLSTNKKIGIGQTIEIIDNFQDIFEQFKRVQLHYPQDLNENNDWFKIAKELTKHEQVLCIVNTRKDCIDLFDLMPKGTYYLSALMCGEHRALVLDEIKNRLHHNLPTRVVSTQLIEAGVDIDFPVVYRALAGADSIVQAAGRCNREGSLSKGHVYIFIPPKPAPAGSLRKGEKITRLLLQTKYDLIHPSTFTDYFKRFYNEASSLDKFDINRLLRNGEQDLHVQFASAAENFRLIEDDAYVAVIVRYGDSKHLIDQLHRGKINRYLLRKLQRFSVNIPKQIHQILVDNGSIIKTDQGLYIQDFDALYDPTKGFIGGYQKHINPEHFVF